MTKNLHALVRDGDVRELAARLGRRFGVELPLGEVASWLVGERRPSLMPSGTDHCLVLWFKNRIEELGFFRPGHLGPIGTDLPVEMHVCFLYLEETPEMIRRLRNETVEYYKAGPARSRITNEVQVIQPIDRVAAMVVSEA